MSNLLEKILVYEVKPRELIGETSKYLYLECPCCHNGLAIKDSRLKKRVSLLLQQKSIYRAKELLGVQVRNLKSYLGTIEKYYLTQTEKPNE